MRVTTRWADGTMLHGWVKKDELTEEGVHHERISDMTPLSAGEGGCDPLRLGANERAVDAPVAAGTQVYAARYLGPWAKVVEGTKLKLRVRPKDDWIEIVGVPGVVCSLGDAWIQRSAAKLPPDDSAAAAPGDTTKK
jgi:hypothetical protein